MINFYNGEVERYCNEGNGIPPKSFVKYKLSTISWSRALLNSVPKNQKKFFDNNCIKIANYRPFFKQYVYHSKDLNGCMYKTLDVFNNDTLCICTQGNGGRKSFTCLAAKGLTDSNYNEAGTLCYPLFKNVKKSDFNLFLDNNSNIEYNITDYAIKKFNEKYLKKITPEEIFNYIYAMLYSKDYRKKFEYDLKKSLPYIPLVNDYNIFKTFSDAGKKLIELHVNYEKVSLYKKCNLIIYPNTNYNVVKMKFSKKRR